MAHIQWSDDGAGNQPFARFANYGALWLVVVMNTDLSTIWCITLDATNGIILRDGHLPSRLSREKSWEVAFEAITAAAESLLEDLIGVLGGQLKASELQPKAFRQGDEHGVLAVCKEIEKCADRLRAEANSLQKIAQDTRVLANSIASTCVDPCGETE